MESVDATMLFATLVFWIIIACIVGGIILLRPVSKRLGNFLDEWIAIRRAEQRSSVEQLTQLTARLAALEGGQHRLLEQQTFMESLKEEGETSTVVSED
jgi:hypothetical protein